MSIKNSPFSIVLLIAWLSVIYMLVPFPDLEKNSIFQLLIWFLGFGVFIFGILACILTINNSKYWKYYVSIASFLFLIKWSLSYLIYSSTLSPLELYISIINGAIGIGMKLSSLFVIYYELLLPLFYLICFMVTTYMVVKEFNSVRK